MRGHLAAHTGLCVPRVGIVRAYTAIKPFRKWSETNARRRMLAIELNRLAGLDLLPARRKASASAFGVFQSCTRTPEYTRLIILTQTE